MIFLFSVCRRRLDLAFLIDGSGSIEAYGRGNFKRCLNFVKRVVASFGISPTQTRVGMVLFSSRAWLVANFRSYRNKPSVLRAISRIRYPRGGTKIGRALRFARNRLFRKRTSRRKVSVIKFFSFLFNPAPHNWSQHWCSAHSRLFYPTQGICIFINVFSFLYCYLYCYLPSVFVFVLLCFCNDNTRSSQDFNCILFK